MSATSTYDCVTCGKPHTSPTEKALALLNLCADCGKKRYAAGKLEQKKTTPPVAATSTGETQK